MKYTCASDPAGRQCAPARVYAHGRSYASGCKYTFGRICEPGHMYVPGPCMYQPLRVCTRQALRAHLPVYMYIYVCIYGAAGRAYTLPDRTYSAGRLRNLLAEHTHLAVNALPHLTLHIALCTQLRARGKG